MKKWFKKCLTGLSVPQEYVCLAVDEPDAPFDLWVTSGTRKFKVDEHVLLGYSPVLIAFAPHASGSPWNDLISLSFREKSNQETVAELELSRENNRVETHSQINIFRATSGWHHLISSFHQAINSSLTQLKNTPNGFIQLQGNLYEQVRIAYTVPRKISVVSLGNRFAMNVFPTDLHGPLGSGHYASSLRIGGKACQQVEQERRLLICDMPLSSHREVYAMGKNHMREMREVSAFDPTPALSVNFRIPIPKHALRYRELEVVDAIDYGLHRVFVYREENMVELHDEACLGHIHAYALQWRIDHGYHTNYQLR